MTILADPVTLAVLLVAVVLLGMAKGGLAGVGALATPLAALVLPPATAAALLLPILIVQDVISVWSFRKTWDGWIIGWMLPGAAVGIAAGYFFAEQVDEAKLMAALGAFPHEVLVAAALLMPLAIVSTLLTVRWLKRIDGARFYVLIYLLMVLLGAKLMWDGLAG